MQTNSANICKRISSAGPRALKQNLPTLCIGVECHRWEQSLASVSEAIVKAEKMAQDLSPKELQELSIKTLSKVSECPK